MLTRRTPLRAKRPAPPRQAKQISCEARPRPVACATAPLPMAAPRPKFDYVRDTRLRDMCRALPCQHCGAAGPGVTWAHSNQAVHGKGKGIKASDVYVAALCTPCHSELDQGATLPEAARVAMWDRAHARTVSAALAAGTWPPGIPTPEATP